MLDRLRRRRRRAADDDLRIYAIGDVHGHKTLFLRLIDRIGDDAEARGPRSTRLVILGDFIDRGPDAAGMIKVLMRLDQEPNVIVLKGNHEAAMADALDGDHDALDLWLAHGGTQTLHSFGVDVDALEIDDSLAVLRAARAAVPATVLRWIKRLPTFVRYGDYYFVHAGIDPAIALDRQTDEARLWITDAFTDSMADHGATIVHGHTIYPGVVVLPNRIGVDTGAYRTGRLSAVGIENGAVWTLGVTLDDPPLISPPSEKHGG